MASSPFRNMRLGREPSGRLSHGEVKNPRTLHLEENQQGKFPPQNLYTCYMDSTEYGGELRYEFSPDPSSIGYSLNANIQTVASRGGQVSYATNRLIGPLEITGQLRNRWQLFELGKFVEKHMAEAMYLGAPLRFVYPERDIDLAVFIQTISPIGLDSTQGELVDYSISCAVTGDHTAVNTTEISGLFNIPLPADIGWIDVETAYQLALQRFPQLVAGAGGGGGGTGEETEGEEGEGEEGETPPEEEGRLDEEGNAQQGPNPGTSGGPTQGGGNLPGPGDRGENRPNDWQAPQNWDL